MTPLSKTEAQHLAYTIQKEEIEHKMFLQIIERWSKMEPRDVLARINKTKEILKNNSK